MHHVKEAFSCMGYAMAVGTCDRQVCQLFSVVSVWEGCTQVHVLVAKMHAVFQVQRQSPAKRWPCVLP